MPMKRRPLVDLVIAVADRAVPALEESGEPRLAVRQWQRHQILAVEMDQVEDEIDQVRAALPFRGVLDQREGGHAVRPHPAKLAIEIGLPGRYREERRGDSRIFAGPVEPGASQQMDIAAVEPCVHAISIELELVAPLVAARRFLYQLAELWLDPRRKFDIPFSSFSDWSGHAAIMPDKSVPSASLGRISRDVGHKRLSAGIPLYSPVLLGQIRAWNCSPENT
jgi:hypothetical protein